MLRSDEEFKCPFGLPISDGCRCAGEVIEKMAPIDEKANQKVQNKILKANLRLFVWYAPGEQCKFASKLFPNKAMVECEFSIEDTGFPVGSPFYYKHFSGIGLDGLYNFPLGFYTDNSIDRGMFYGMYSIESTGYINYIDGLGVSHFIKLADNKK